VVGWCVADVESAELFRPLLDGAIANHHVPPGQLTLHADRGGPMTAKSTALLLADLGVTRSHSRPHTSNDNPFSESQFKNLKYQPQFPERFGCIEDARGFSRNYFGWYNEDHHHVGIGLMTPNQVHYGQVDAVYAARQGTLDRACREHPERFVNKTPTPPAKPTATWINPPKLLQRTSPSLIVATSADLPGEVEAADWANGVADQTRQSQAKHAQASTASRLAARPAPAAFNLPRSKDPKIRA
jgi:hypothetical protein